MDVLRFTTMQVGGLVALGAVLGVGGMLWVTAASSRRRVIGCILAQLAAAAIMIVLFTHNPIAGGG